MAEEVLRLQCVCPVCGSEGKLGGQMDLYGVSLSKTPVPIHHAYLFAKWLKNGRWPSQLLLEFADTLEREKDWFQCASCDYYFPVPIAHVYAIKLLALQFSSRDWAQALDTLSLMRRPPD